MTNTGEDRDTKKPSSEVGDERDQGVDVERKIGELTDELAAARPAPAAPSPRKPAATPFWRSLPVAIVALLIAIAMTVANLVGWGPLQGGPAPPTPAEERQTHELELLALVGYIEDYRADHDRLPGELDELELDLGDAAAEYDLVDDGQFVVALIKNGERRTYDSRLEPSDGPKPATG